MIPNGDELDEWKSFSETSESLVGDIPCSLVEGLGGFGIVSSASRNG